MSEQLNESRAARFEQLHIYPPVDYDTYCDEMITQWQEGVEESIENNEPIKAMWLRRNGESYTEFAAHVDYVLPDTEYPRYFASIDVENDGGRAEIQVWLPNEDGSGEPIVASAEPYDMDSLERAISLVESHFANND